MQVRTLSGEDPLEEGMATHSSTLAWRIPWTEEPGGPWSMVLAGYSCKESDTTEVTDHSRTCTEPKTFSFFAFWVNDTLIYGLMQANILGNHKGHFSFLSFSFILTLTKSHLFFLLILPCIHALFSTSMLIQASVFLSLIHSDGLQNGSLPFFTHISLLATLQLERFSKHRSYHTSPPFPWSKIHQ